MARLNSPGRSELWVFMWPKWCLECTSCQRMSPWPWIVENGVISIRGGHTKHCNLGKVMPHETAWKHPGPIGLTLLGVPVFFWGRPYSKLLISTVAVDWTGENGCRHDRVTDDSLGLLMDLKTFKVSEIWKILSIRHERSYTCCIFPMFASCVCSCLFNVWGSFGSREAAFKSVDDIGWA